MIFYVFNVTFVMILHVCHSNWQSFEIVAANEQRKSQSDHNWRTEYEYKTNQINRNETFEINMGDALGYKALNCKKKLYTKQIFLRQGIQD